MTVNFEDILASEEEIKKAYPNPNKDYSLEELRKKREDIAINIRRINDLDISHDEKEVQMYFLDREMEEVEELIAVLELHEEED